MFDLVVIKKLPKYLLKWRTNPDHLCIVIHNSRTQVLQSKGNKMNAITKLVTETLNVSMEDAATWLNRIETWDDMDCSEWSESKMRKHIKAFVSDWETIYSKVGA